MTPSECTRRFETIQSRRQRLADAPNDRARKSRTKALRRAKRKHVEALAEFLGVGEPTPWCKVFKISPIQGTVLTYDDRSRTYTLRDAV